MSDLPWRLDELPQTSCHQDAFEHDLMLSGGQIAAIDWAYAGIAPMGAELALLIAAATAGSLPSRLNSWTVPALAPT